MNESYIKNVIEAALLAAGRPLQIVELTQLFEESDMPEAAAIRAALDSLEADYTGRGIEVKETATGYRIQVRRDLANEISRLWPERPPRYSRALLETLALIAYRQPITRAEIEAVRGVAVNPNIIKTVLERNWVRVVGLRDVPGRPELLGTTKEFLDYFGLRGLEDLPALAELKAMGDINLQLDLAKAENDLPRLEGMGEAAAEGAAVGAVALLANETPSNDEVSADVPGDDATAIGEAAAIDSDVENTSSELTAEDGTLDTNTADDDERVLTEASAESESSSEGDAAAQDADPLEDVDFDDAPGQDDDSDEDELSASDSKNAGELVAASRDVDD